MNVAILETCADGHHLVYVRHLAAAAGTWSWVTLPGVELSPEYAANLAHCPPVAIAYGKGAPQEQLAVAYRHAAAMGAERLIIPDGDRYLWPLLLRSLTSRKKPSFSVFVLVMRTTPRSSRARDRLRNRLKALVAAALARRPGIIVGFLTDAFGVVGARPGFDRVVAVPDPVDVSCVPETPVTSAANCAQADAELTIGVFGAISWQKNPLMLLDAAAAHGRTIVRLAGRIDPDLLDSLQRSASWRSLAESNRLRVTNRFLDRDEFAAELQSVDVVAILHSHDAPSGILAEAALRGTPALVADGGWLAEIIGDLGIGRVARIDCRQIASMLEQFRSNPAAFRRALSACRSRLGKEAFLSAALGQPAWGTGVTAIASHAIPRL